MPIKITSQRDMFRRCGMAHPKEATTHPDGTFTKKELAILQAETMLTVEIVADPEAEKAAAEKAEAEKGEAEKGEAEKAKAEKGEAENGGDGQSAANLNPADQSDKKASAQAKPAAKPKAKPKASK